MPQLEFTAVELEAMKKTLFAGFSQEQFDLCIAEAQRRNLIPGSHLVFQLRNSKEWDASLGASVATKKIVKITTVEALRLIAQRTGEYLGQGDGEFIYLDAEGKPTIFSEIPLPHPTIPGLPMEPWAARIPVYRKGHPHPTRVVARFDAYAVTTRRNNETVLSEMWSRRGPEQILKCSLAASLRATFAEELGGLYLQEEFQKEDSEKTPEVPVVVVPVPRIAVVPTVDHKPAQPTNAARPGHEEKASNGSLSDAINKTLEESLVPRKGDLSDPAYVGETITAEKIVQVVSDVGLHDLNGPVKEVSKRGRKPKTEAVEPEQSESHVIVGGSENTTPIATDDDLPDNMFDDGEPVRKMDNPEPLQDNRLPNKAEGAEIAAKVRSYYVHVANKDLQTYILKTSGKILKTDITAPAQIPQRVWTEVFAKMDTELEKGGKAALVNLVTF